LDEQLSEQVVKRFLELRILDQNSIRHPSRIGDFLGLVDEHDDTKRQRRPHPPDDSCELDAGYPGELCVGDDYIKMPGVSKDKSFSSMSRSNGLPPSSAQQDFDDAAGRGAIIDHQRTFCHKSSFCY
jgi:hypothetical protein